MTSLVLNELPKETMQFYADAVYDWHQLTFIKQRFSLQLILISLYTSY